MLEGLDKVSHLAWKKLGILQEKVKEMPGEKDTEAIQLLKPLLELLEEQN